MLCPIINRNAERQHFRAVVLLTQKALDKVIVSKYWRNQESGLRVGIGKSETVML